MIVSWHWLKDYVKLEMSPDELAHRLAMAGLNHESTEHVGDDLAIDLEITSNRPDCLGHLGVAREISVLWKQDLQMPEFSCKESKTACSDLIDIQIEQPELCPRYTARVIQGVKIGPSPTWLAKRLETLGIAVISNIVDITNYVMMECGQPLHAFDYDKIGGKKIIVRSAKPNEPFIAIDHHEYELSKGMCVIADAKRPIALAGVMGGYDTEVSDQTTNILVESADFAPLAVRAAARTLRLHSPSSYRFERGVDPEGIDWASRRACQLIQEIAGGELAAGSVDVHPIPSKQAGPVVLRWSQIERVLGIRLEPDVVERILLDLGLERKDRDDQSITVTSPSWRRDLTREIDLIEEVARIHGYDEIPEDVGVAMCPSKRTSRHRVLAALRTALTSQGFNEALTPSVVDERTSSLYSPWTNHDPIRCNPPMLRGADCLRRSVVPSLLEARRTNESLANDVVELFETAKVYLPSKGSLPEEHWMLAISSGRDFRHLKGIIEAMMDLLHIPYGLEANPVESPLLDAAEAAELVIQGERLGFLGTLSKEGQKAAGLRRASTVAELKIAVLEQFSELVPQFAALSPYPAISYDFNFVVDEQVRWDDLSTQVSAAAGPLLESINYQETYRDPAKDGKNKKRLLLSVTLRSHDHTLTGDEADAVRQAIIAACETKLSASLL